MQMTLTDDHDTADYDTADFSARPPRPAFAGRMRLATETAERRRGLRVRQARPVKLLDLALTRTIVGRTVDVSATGLRVELTGGAGLRTGTCSASTSA